LIERYSLFNGLRAIFQVMKTVYIEPSIVSYLKARPARDLLGAAWQNATNEWWDTQRGHFDLYTSQLVVDEVQ
jgi:hypothetical protein